MTKKQFVIQQVLELAIPILGVLFWKWSAAFVLCYFFLDGLSWFSLFILKGKKRINFTNSQDDKTSLSFTLGLAFFQLLILTICAFTALKSANPNLNLFKEISDFLWYKEMGIAQVYILIPLLILATWMQFKQSFLMTAKFRTFSNQEMLLNQRKQFVICLLFAAVCSPVAFFVPLHNYVIIAVTLLFSFFLRMKFRA